MLKHPCTLLPGIGPALAAKLERCGMSTVADLLFHLPFRYQDRTRITPIADLRLNDYAVIAGRVIKTEVKYGKRMMLYCYVEDKTGVVRLRFFHFNNSQMKALQQMPFIRAFGEIREFADYFEMIHPEYQLQNGADEITVEETLTPIYSTTEGLSQNRLRQLIKIILKKFSAELVHLEWMSMPELNQLGLPPLGEALELIHQPPPDISLQGLEEGTHPAIQRLAYEELLAHNLSMQFARQHRQKMIAPKLPANKKIQTQFLQQLPFHLTAAQQRVCSEIICDLGSSQPMLRLVQGDVGCGKTTVAAVAALQCMTNGYQVAFMAPTDLLTEQHAENFKRWLTPLGIRCWRLSGKMKTKEKKEALHALKHHDCDLIIGTHALFQEQVDFSKLGLIIIDEQHRFGVEQRIGLHEKGRHNNQVPHQLLMTATPIPRTLSMTQFAHLDISIIDELPPGRIPVQTAVISQDKRDLIIDRLHTAIAEGKQVYWVCTLIEESEKLQCMAATNTAAELQLQLPNCRIGLIHGKLKASEKEKTMDAFKKGELDLLVATTVIEVGVDVPNASLMIIENAERLGLSQLHQLRGRVGRGAKQSYCLLVYQTPLSTLGSERLKLMKQTNDGFLIAEKDLQLRGSGEILGTKQTGYRQFKIADLHRDSQLLPIVNKKARELIRESHPLAMMIANNWLGHSEQFLQG